MKIRIAQIRIVPEEGEISRNLSVLLSVLSEVSAENVDVIVTPECFLDGYVVRRDHVTSESMKEYALDPVSDPRLREISAWADENSAWIVLGCCRSAPEGVCNTALIYDRDGSLAGSYDKTHCQRHDRKCIPGGALPVFNSDFGLFGVMICADRRWPETVRSLALQGARVIFNPTYGMHDDRNLCMMRTRSYESEVFIAFTHPVQSLVTDPSGDVLCNDTCDDVKFSVTEIDLSKVDKVRASESAHLRDRRSDIYYNAAHTAAVSRWTDHACGLASVPPNGHTID